ncbi:mechanosensitive ion channel [Synechococcus sp. ATX 2A4]|uniref:mechanosensitive ion channel family protein n=1 Tax=Synechococcus sp. ATX 2A4 TaxID=2823727 RepID=UPI0020CE756A|nr:mechanosensitive ion channel domain-containing protein [Synechococcus sp. ATX 2A4]MCP9886036.1 mechanosensitive ion channel [Synechococcus sp. ATX 2A4]
MNTLLYEITGWAGYLSRPVVLVQCLSAAALLTLFLTVVRPRLRHRGRRLALLGAVGLLLALRLNALALEWLGQPHGLALYFAQIYGIWLFLAVLREVLLLRCSARGVEQLFSQIVQPLYVLLVAGSLVNQLDSLEDVADIPLLPVFGDTLTTGNLFLLLTIPYFLVAVSAYPVSWLARVLQGLLHFSEGTREATTLVLRYLLIGAGVLWLMHRVGLNPNAIAAIAGGLSVGIGFGIKEVFSNFISGLWLLFEGSVRPGEILFIDGDPCEVRSLGLRAAVLWRDRDNAELVIPNQDFFTTTTVTYTGTDRLRRSQVEVAAAYRHDPAQVIPLLEDVARLSPRVLSQPPPKALLLSYGDSGINYGLRFWIEDPMNNASIKSEVSVAVWERFAKEGIEMPFPQRVIHQAEG